MNNQNDVMVPLYQTPQTFDKSLHTCMFLSLHRFLLISPLKIQAQVYSFADKAIAFRIFLGTPKLS